MMIVPYSLMLYKMAAAGIIFLLTLLAAYYPITKQTNQHIAFIELSEAFASGIFLGLAFFHMLPEAITVLQRLQTCAILPEIICLGAFLFFLLLEKLAMQHHELCRTTTLPYMLLLILTLHALLEGTALGSGATFMNMIVLSLAIIAHKGGESFALSIAFLQHKLPTRQSILLLLLFSSVTPIGILLGMQLEMLTTTTAGQWGKAIYNAFAAGAFLYMSTLHHVRFHEHNASHHPAPLQSWGMLLAGVSVMGGVGLLI